MRVRVRHFACVQAPEILLDNFGSFVHNILMNTNTTDRETTTETYMDTADATTTEIPRETMRQVVAYVMAEKAAREARLNAMTVRS